MSAAGPVPVAAPAAPAPSAPAPSARPRAVRPVPVDELAAVIAAVEPGLVPAAATDPTGTAVTGVTLRASDVRPRDLFAALAGARAHGADFAAEAIARGAAAVLTDP